MQLSKITLKISMMKASAFMEFLRSQRNFIKKALIPLKESSQDT